MIFFRSKERLITFLVVLIFGIIIFLLGLGSTGLVDETPPLFAAAGKAMSESGDWLTPKVNGIFRFDKPPLIYWLMGLFYSLPKNEVWDSLGTISARLPSLTHTIGFLLQKEQFQNSQNSQSPTTNKWLFSASADYYTSVLKL